MVVIRSDVSAEWSFALCDGNSFLNLPKEVPLRFDSVSFRTWTWLRREIWSKCRRVSKKRSLRLKFGPEQSKWRHNRISTYGVESYGLDEALEETLAPAPTSREPLFKFAFAGWKSSKSWVLGGGEKKRWRVLRNVFTPGRRKSLTCHQVIGE